MAFFKFRQRGQPPADGAQRPEEPAAPGPQETIDSLRRRARQRLIGAAVLVLVAVIGFPLLFDTQPRPVTVDAPITIPDKDKVAPLPAPASGSVPTAASLGDREQVVTQPPAQHANAVAAAPIQPVLPAQPAAPDATAGRPAARPPVETPTTPPAQSADNAHAQQEEQAQRAKREQEARARREADARAKRDEAARARALLEGRAPPPANAGATAAAPPAAGNGRFIVQVGAFATDDKVREVRQQAERAGVKTYTQIVNTPEGARTRVRVGPYASRAEAEKAAAVLKKAGLGSSILAL
jgi:DedD protein